MRPLLQMCGVYEIVNLVNGKRYVGSAAQGFSNRFGGHKSKLNALRHRNRHLQSAWTKYGSNAFRFNILLICSVELVLMYEQIFMDALKPEYNLSPTAGSTLGLKHSEESRATHSRLRKAYMVSLDPAARERLQAAQRHPDSRAKMSASAKAMDKSARARIGSAIAAALKGKPRSPEEIARRGTPEARLKISVAAKARVNTPKGRAQLLSASAAGNRAKQILRTTALAKQLPLKL